MAAVYTLRIDAGATFTRQFTYTNPDGSVFDLDGYTALMHIRETAEADLALEVVPVIDVEEGTISITITAADTATLTAPEYVWAMELTAAGGEPVVRLLQGKVLVSPEVVRD
jgi:hypothetical protein